MNAFLPLWVTYLALVVFVLLAVVPPRLHFGLRLLVLFVLAGLLLALGVLAPDVYFEAFPPLDEAVGSFNGWMIGAMGLVLSLPVALVAWGIRKVLAGRASR